MGDRNDGGPFIFSCFFKLLLGSASREEGSKGISLDLIFGERIPKKDLIFWTLI
jgi:hypothetical protein